MHNLRDFSSFSEALANSVVKEFNQAILDAVTVADVRASAVLSSSPLICYNSPSQGKKR